MSADDWKHEAWRTLGHLECEVPEETIVGYLLSETHPVGRWKAPFFAAMGFTATHPAAFRRAVRAFVGDSSVTATGFTEYGLNYDVDGYMIIREHPDGHLDGEDRVRLRTSWVITHEGAAPRLLTAYPL